MIQLVNNMRRRVWATALGNAVAMYDLQDPQRDRRPPCLFTICDLDVRRLRREFSQMRLSQGKGGEIWVSVNFAGGAGKRFGEFLRIDS